VGLENKIAGVNKLRDYKICIDYISGRSPQEIITKRSLMLSVRRVFQILYANAAFINPRVAWPKARRIQLRQRIVEDSPQKSKKDIIDQLNDLTKEIEGDKPVIDNSQHLHFTNLSDDELIKKARERGVALPIAIASRIEEPSKQE